jgi:Putative Actinobacterial Holin-X, holin superfamily III
MEAQKDTPPPIIDQLKEYAETRLKLAKYEAIDRSTAVIASMITDVIVAITLILTFLFLSFSFAFYLSHVLGSYWQGFGCTAILYLIIAIIIILIKDKLRQPIINLFLKRLFK